jgi:Na+-translocating ferredoxin:NAD+ oxidoreductase RNF subunit RnfB
VISGAYMSRNPGSAAGVATRTSIVFGSSVVHPPGADDDELHPMNPDAVALIDESRCIGCALCLPPCPVDAIVGAANQHRWQPHRDDLLVLGQDKDDRVEVFVHRKRRAD